MIGDAAPFFADVAGGPPCHAVWRTALDGVRLRVALWPEGTRGSVAILPGRTEWCEKYADAARHLAARGYAAAAIDWRGQGLTERVARDRMLGHVGDFADYQRDLDAMLDAMDAAGLPRPFHLLPHSMGGAIGLRGLLRGVRAERAVFSAPMWGLPLLPHRRLMAWAASHLGTLLGFGTAGVPLSGKVTDPAGAAFEGNLLTTDPAMFEWMRAQLAAHPELALGAPTLGWLRAALREMRALAGAPSPDMPCLVLLGTDEGIVDPAAIRDRVRRWPGAGIETVPGGRHEVLMEDDATRARLYDRVAAQLGG